MWRYRFHDLQTNTYLTELPLVDVEFERNFPIAGPGTFAARLRLGDIRIEHTNWRSALADPDRYSVCYSDSNGVIKGAHIIYDSIYHYSNSTLELSGLELWSANHHRYISALRTYTGVDQLDIARDLLIKEAAQTGGSILLQVDPVGTVPLSGRLRDRTYKATDGKDLAEAVEQLSSVIDGFDFDLVVDYDSNRIPRRRLILGYPRLGRSNSGIAYRLPGAIEDFDWPRLGSQAISRAISISDQALRVDATDYRRIGAGSPLFEKTFSYSGITDATTLGGHSAANLAMRDRPATIPSVTVQLGKEPNSLGDDIYISIAEQRAGFFAVARYSPDKQDHSLQGTFRLVGMKFRPDKNRVQLMLNTTDVIDARNQAIAGGLPPGQVTGDIQVVTVT